MFEVAEVYYNYIEIKKIKNSVMGKAENENFKYIFLIYPSAWKSS